jgi:hypothetical protein
MFFEDIDAGRLGLDYVIRKSRWWWRSLCRQDVEHIRGGNQAIGVIEIAHTKAIYIANTGLVPIGFAAYPVF